MNTYPTEREGSYITIAIGIFTKVIVSDPLV